MQQVNHGLVGHGLFNLVTLYKQRRQPVVARIAGRFLRQPAFANARLTLHQRHSPVPTGGAPNQIDQLPILMLASHQGRPAERIDLHDDGAYGRWVICCSHHLAVLDLSIQIDRFVHGGHTKLRLQHARALLVHIQRCALLTSAIVIQHQAAVRGFMVVVMRQDFAA